MISQSHYIQTSLSRLVLKTCILIGVIKKQLGGSTMSFNIALAGKGSSGKSSLAPLIGSYLTQKAKPYFLKTLIIDADPNTVASKLIGLPVKTTVGSLFSENERQLRAAKIEEEGLTREEYMIQKVISGALIKTPNFDYLSMGHWELEGCQCGVNRITMRTIQTLAKKYSFVITDHEAGVEMMGRYAEVAIDVLFLVVTPDPTFMQVAKNILDRALEVGKKIDQVHFIVNRYDERDGISQSQILSQLISIMGQGSLSVAGFLPESSALKQLHYQNDQTIFSIPKTDPWVLSVNQMLSNVLNPITIPAFSLTGQIPRQTPGLC
ncbi:MAG: hypothetical protein AB9888_15215 [Bacteroidales bacterium]